MQPDAEPTFASLLIRHRRQAGLTHEQLAEAAGISPRTISDLERGIKKKPHDATLQLLIQALGLTGPERQAFEEAARPPGAPGGDPRPPEAPFIAGPPITQPRHFFGREQEVKRLLRLLQGRPLQHAAINGPRRSGKTSLLYYLRAIMAATPAELRTDQPSDWARPGQRYRWLFVDFQNPQLLRQEGFFRHILTGLDYPIPDPCDLENFLDLVAARLREPTVLLLDEMDLVLKRSPELDDTFWEGLRWLATNVAGGNLAFIVASHEPLDHLTRQGSLGSPFFNIFAYNVTLGPLTEGAARQLIASAPVSFPDEDVEWIIQQSGLWPLLLQILCRECLAALEDGTPQEVWWPAALQQTARFAHLLAARTPGG